MDDIALRIKSLVDHFSNGNNSAFARMMGIPEKNIRNYIEGVQPKASFLTDVCVKLGVSAEWLLIGTNGMFSRPNSGHLQTT